MLEYKIALLGPPRVGKSCISQLYTQSIFIDQYIPTIEDTYRKNIVLNDTKIIVEVIDTIGTNDCNLLNVYIKKCDGLIMVFSLVESSSFDCCKDILEYTLLSRPIPLLLVGNKCDLTSQLKLNSNDINTLCSQHNIEYIPISAKKNINVDKAFVNTRINETLIMD